MRPAGFPVDRDATMNTLPNTTPNSARRACRLAARPAGPAFTGESRATCIAGSFAECRRTLRRHGRGAGSRTRTAAPGDASASGGARSAPANAPAQPPGRGRGDAAPAAAGRGRGRGFDEAAIARAKPVFEPQCGFCHGNNARGRAGGPDLARSLVVLADTGGKEMAGFIRAGRPERGMPAFPGLTDQQIARHRRVPARAARSGAQPRRRPTRWRRSSATPRPGRRTSTGRAAARPAIPSTGDLAGIGAKYDPPTLQGRLVNPRPGGGRGQAAVVSPARDAHGHGHARQWPDGLGRARLHLGVRGHADRDRPAPAGRSSGKATCRRSSSPIRCRRTSTCSALSATRTCRI